jgi:CelD/BcsL family acetyltransferase involved in cellulose biosynthesis
VTTYTINPLVDPRWPDFLQRHPKASVFHSRGWLDALQQTYGYEPVVYTTSPPGTELKNGWVFCRIDSWLTGRRLVSLPFSDHCDPLVQEPEELHSLAHQLRQEQELRQWKYIELRPPAPEPVIPDGFQVSETFALHKIDLQPTSSELFGNLHRDSTQRKIRRAEREGLTYDEGRSEELVDRFYRLIRQTRRRHRVPPQPSKWFANLVMYLGDSVKIRVACRQEQPVAGILTLRFQNTLVYKYGASDARFQNLGGMHLCLWRAIEEAKDAGLREFDLGRSDLENEGLITFKDRWGARRGSLTYFRQWLHAPRSGIAPWQTPLAKKALAHAPDALRDIAGRLLYRHLG